ncbi:hypothetical protein QBC38DRAFT_405925 [Podospora fimiseda]|uniref:COP9 signalosome complex subunit 4 n=1 Tax=Podospora fimiseda TaxID=252190 RepID=A0AAN7H557_9PEZI|nr:hypothetical protein QBC38DRAFT_405925 [Podospora fimiseda]
MVSPKVHAALEAARKTPAPGYRDLLTTIQDLSPPEDLATDLQAVLEDILDANLGVVTTRILMREYIPIIKSQASSNPNLAIKVGSHALQVIAQKTTISSSFIDQTSNIREIIATAYENLEDWTSAARVLSEIPIDTSQRRLADDEKAGIWVRIVRCYLEVDDATKAETYLNKLKNIMHKVSDPVTNLHFKLSTARIQDSNNSFLNAAHSYYDISLIQEIDEDERFRTLSMAIKCAILAPAGPQRSKALGKLYKDERSIKLEEHGILEKMFFDRLIEQDEVEKFSKGLAPHQLAKTSDGSTVLARAVCEHNLLSAGKLYANIGFDELGVLLGVSGERAEDTTAKMIEQGRLKASMDQIGRYIYFEAGEPSGESGSGHAEAVFGKEIRRWDASVHTATEDVERLANLLQAEFPLFVASNLMVK